MAYFLGSGRGTRYQHVKIPNKFNKTTCVAGACVWCL
jgi:hypothetical protein